MADQATMADQRDHRTTVVSNEVNLADLRARETPPSDVKRVATANLDLVVDARNPKVGVRETADSAIPALIKIINDIAPDKIRGFFLVIVSGHCAVIIG